MIEKNIHSWGMYPKAKAQIIEPRFYKELKDELATSNPIIARGAGLSYGDSALSNTLLLTSHLDKIVGFDPEKGSISVQSGITLDKVLKYIVPRGYFLPVTPGTKWISVGGAVAADVHGKNHHKEGSFSNYVNAFSLMTKGGEVIQCSRDENAELFWKTIGGMGLTGIILDVSFSLKKIETSYIAQTSIKTKNLEETLDLFEQYSSCTYVVSWVDCLAKGSKLGRGIVFAGEHCALDSLPKSKCGNPLKTHSDPKINIPFIFPRFTLSPLTVRAFNFLYYNKQIGARADSIIHYDPFFYPLDGVKNWNRLYGNKGFIQYQFVLPKTEEGRRGLKKIIAEITASKQASFLVVLKELGAAQKLSPLSFPELGYTLALDFKVSDKVFQLLDKLDVLVETYGGKQYLAKDSRMSAQHFASTYTHEMKDLGFESLQSKRLNVL